MQSIYQTDFPAIIGEAEHYQSPELLEYAEQKADKWAEKYHCTQSEVLTTELDLACLKAEIDVARMFSESRSMLFAHCNPHVHENVQINSLFDVPTTDNTSSHYRTKAPKLRQSLFSPYSTRKLFLPLANSCSVSETDLRQRPNRLAQRLTRDKARYKPPDKSSTQSSHSLEHGSSDNMLMNITNEIHKLKESTQIWQNVHSATEYNLRHIPKFAGKVDEDFEEWRRKFLNKIKYLPWPIEQQIILLDDALIGRANLFYRQLPDAIKHSMPDILSALSKQYSADNIDLVERTRLSKRKQMPGESLDDYTLSILQIVQRLQMTNKLDQVSFYIDGLDSDIRGDVYKMKPSSIEQAERDARLAINVRTLQAKNLAAQISTDSHSDSEAYIVEPQIANTNESAPIFSCSPVSTAPPARSGN